MKTRLNQQQTQDLINLGILSLGAASTIVARKRALKNDAQITFSLEELYYFLPPAIEVKGKQYYLHSGYFSGNCWIAKYWSYSGDCLCEARGDELLYALYGLLSWMLKHKKEALFRMPLQINEPALFANTVTELCNGTGCLCYFKEIKDNKLVAMDGQSFKAAVPFSRFTIGEPNKIRKNIIMVTDDLPHLPFQNYEDL